MSTATYQRHTHTPTSKRHERRRASTRRSERPASVRPLLEILALVAIVALLIAGVILTSGRVSAQVPTSRVFVDRGETLWAIAVQHPIAGQTTEQTAQSIADLNGVQSGRLVAGDVIDVPAARIHRVLTASR
jgi:hypothetical protein